jgi:leader peptidase (prepilin peptidase) / N-methyltransferase
MEALALSLAGIGGLIFGSFLNVVVYRVPRKESIVRPASRCPSCGHELSVADNIPVLSWVLLRGRCRYCRAPISIRYPAAELLTAAIWMLAVVRREHLAPPGTPPDGVGWQLLGFLPFLWVLVALSLIDLEHKILPNRIVYPSVLAAIPLLAITAALGPGLEPWIRALLGGLAGAGGFLIVALISPAGMGMGDVKLAGLIGLFVGYLGWGRLLVAFFASFAAGALVGIMLMIVRRAGRKTQIPFGPFMALGAIISTLAGENLLDLYR